MRLTGRPRSGGLRAFPAVAHALEDFRPVFRVLDGLAHQLQKDFFLEIAAPALAAVEVDVMAAATFGERVPLARRLNRSTKRSLAHASGPRAQNSQRRTQRPTHRNRL